MRDWLMVAQRRLRASLLPIAAERAEAPRDFKISRRRSGAFSFDGAASEAEFGEAENDDVKELNGDVVDGGGLDEDGVEAPVEDAGNQDAGHEDDELVSELFVGIAIKHKMDADEEVDDDLDNEDERIGSGLRPEESFDKKPIQRYGDEERRDTE